VVDVVGELYGTRSLCRVIAVGQCGVVRRLKSTRRREGYGEERTRKSGLGFGVRGGGAWDRFLMMVWFALGRHV